VALTAAIVTVVGLVASVDVLFKGTMGALRRE
jgi:hypothetical protein